jgi:hypothetical protein
MQTRKWERKEANCGVNFVVEELNFLVLMEMNSFIFASSIFLQRWF